MKKNKIISLVALTALIGTTVVPMSVAAAADNAATGGVEVSYTANSSSIDKANWLVSYPKKVVLSDHNKDNATGVSMDFKLLDKISSGTYTGDSKVEVSVGGYIVGGIDMTGGTVGTAKMGISDSTGSELAAPKYMVVELSKTTLSGTGKAYLTSVSTDAEGTFTKNVTFTFTDTTITN